MKFKIIYDFKNNSLENTKELFIYDFGSIKVFVFDNSIDVYKILDKKDNFEIVEDYDGYLPLDLISLEKYQCNFNNKIYTTESFSINVQPYLDFQATTFQPATIPPSLSPCLPRLLSSPRLQSQSFQREQYSHRSSSQPSVLKHQPLQNQQNTNNKKSFLQKKQNFSQAQEFSQLQGEFPKVKKEYSSLQDPSTSWISLDQISQIHQQQIKGYLQPHPPCPPHSLSKKHQNSLRVRQDLTPLSKGHQMKGHQNVLL